MDLTETIAPKSDQLNADDLLGGPRTVRITEVRKGSAEQPVELHLEGLNGRPYKPGKSMRRVLVAAWGPESTAYPGRSLTLYTDPAVKFGGSEVGGIRISHMTDLTAPLKVNLTVTRGKRALFTVQPLVNTGPSREDRIAKAVNAISGAADVAAVDSTWARIIKGGLNDAPELVTARDQRLAQLGGAA